MLQSAAWMNCGLPLPWVTGQADGSSDVFMDTINRDASLRLLVGLTLPLYGAELTSQQTRAARQSAGRQFVLITPQSMASVDREVDVKIIKYATLAGLSPRVQLLKYVRLRDPERNQSTLDFGRA